MSSAGFWEANERAVELPRPLGLTPVTRTARFKAG